MGLHPGVIAYTPADTANFERTQAFSAVAWVNLAANKNQAVVSRMDPGTVLRGWFLYVTTTRRLGFFLINDATGATNEIAIQTQFASLFAINTWVNIGITYDGSSTAAGCIFYVNGVAQVANIVTHDTLTATTKSLATSPFQVGNNPVYGFLNGKIDEVQLYDKALTAANMVTLYNAGTGTETMIAGNNYLQYHMNEASGFQVADSTNSGRGATTAAGATFVAGKLNNCVQLNGSTQYVEAI